VVNQFGAATLEPGAAAEAAVVEGGLAAAAAARGPHDEVGRCRLNR